MWTKIPTKLFPDFCPEIFCTFLGASWKLFGASCRLPCLWYYILSPQEAQKASRKPPRSYKKFQGRNRYNILVPILVATMTAKRHFQINWPLVKHFNKNYAIKLLLSTWPFWNLWYLLNDNFKKSFDQQNETHNSHPQTSTSNFPP